MLIDGRKLSLQLVAEASFVPAAIFRDGLLYLKEHESRPAGRSQANRLLKLRPARLELLGRQLLQEAPCSLGARVGHGEKRRMRFLGPCPIRPALQQALSRCGKIRVIREAN